MARENKEYISLKEASEISGYSPDYVGQLIRNGKLPGKQVFQQLVWMTTEEDLRSYMETKRTQATEGAEAGVPWSKRLFPGKKGSVEVPRAAIRALYAAIALAVFLFLLLFYIFSSSVEHRLDQRALERVEANTAS